MNINVNEKALQPAIDMYLPGADVEVVVDYFQSRHVSELPEEALETVLQSCRQEFEIQAM
ncbi:hypothetical protein J4N45_10110 [Vibrio sp. SCSIO 43140]|uniref:hypothetical protein n=1 Tax=Vibrio sp. SCSIO 43140 TaxID=2819100 RepID=UPI0020756D5D|nr:hypothetical protein [Vibrio sp. SCSIO 43140]USD58883.1 hypothetical protein J4N45_10110 [Vibrio sp. SCSIO 43140]